MTGPSQSSLHESPLSLRHDEEIEETIEQGADQIIITNHRVCLAEADTAGIDWAIERQNINTVEATAIGGERLRAWGLGSLLLGPSMLVSSVVIPWDSLMPDSPLGQAEMAAGTRFGAGWALQLIEVVYKAVSHIDTVLFFGGAFIIGVGVLLLLGGVLRRQSVLAIETADGRVFHSSSFWSSAARIESAIAQPNHRNGD